MKLVGMIWFPYPCAPRRTGIAARLVPILGCGLPLPGKSLGNPHLQGGPRAE
jgi:hypothetical protein